MTTRSLAGAGVLITRPRHQAAEVQAAVAAAGGRPVLFPVMAIEPVPADDVRAQLSVSTEPDIVIFVSPNAVRHGIAHAAGGRIGVIGPATRRAVEAAGHEVDIEPAGGFDSEHLLATPELADVDDKVVRIVRGRSGRELLAETLEARGARVEYLAVYERVVPKPGADELERLGSLWTEGAIAVVIVMSVESLDNLVQMLPDACRQRLANTRLVTPAPRVIKEALTRFPGIPTTLAVSPDANDLVDAVGDAVSADPRTIPG